MRLKVSLGEENVEKTNGNNWFLIGLGYCLTRFRISLGEEHVKKTYRKPQVFDRFRVLPDEV